MTANRYAIDDQGKPIELELYKFDSCPYCRLVQRTIDELNIALEFRDTRSETGRRDELIARGGRAQVPCLFVNGEAMYESADIVTFLKAQSYSEAA